MEKYRYAKVYDEKNGEVKTVEFKDLKKGMIFKLFEENGEPLTRGSLWYVSLSDAYANGDGYFQIDILFETSNDISSIGSKYSLTE